MMRFNAIAALSICAAPAIAEGVTDADMAGVRQQIMACWNPPVGSPGIVITFRLDISGQVVGDIHIVEPDLADDAVNDAFQAAKRAVLRCQGDGFQLPAAHFAEWERMELTFSAVTAPPLS